MKGSKICLGSKEFRAKIAPVDTTLNYKNMTRQSLSTPEAYKNLSECEKQQLKCMSSDIDQPIDAKLNFKITSNRCFICRHDVKLDYKNSRLLSQFCSPYSGRIYGRHITGLCIPMQEQLSNLIHISRQFGFMPKHMKNPNFLNDPVLSKQRLRSLPK